MILNRSDPVFVSKDPINNKLAQVLVMNKDRWIEKQMMNPMIIQQEETKMCYRFSMYIPLKIPPQQFMHNIGNFISIKTHIHVQYISIYKDPIDVVTFKWYLNYRCYMVNMIKIITAVCINKLHTIGIFNMRQKPQAVHWNELRTVDTCFSMISPVKRWKCKGGTQQTK